MTTDPPDSGSGAAPRRRRPRYAGTHPRRFEERYKERNLQHYPEIEAHVRAQGRTPAGTHLPIMVPEVLAALRPLPGDVVADVTLGYGGHAQAFLERTAPTGRLIGLDLDGAQLTATSQRLMRLFDPPRLRLHHSHFAGLPQVLAAEGLDAVDVLFADLGVSSMQVDDPARGFSYKHDGPLDMRMDLRRPRTAADLLRELSLEALAAALRDLADEPAHAAIARAIVQRRALRPILQTGDLVAVVLAAQGLTRRTWRAQTGARGAALHPAARTFQALRILVNDELHGLEQLLRLAPYCLQPGGRLGLLTFHSGEDRRVKHALRAGLDTGIYTEVAGEPVCPNPAERRANPRSTAAKLRWALRSARPWTG